MSEVIKTKYGNATLNNYGYYHISSGKEGNHGKYLHRLIFEDFYNIKLDEEFPEGIEIHHIDGDKTNNEIWNLEPVSKSEHRQMHLYNDENPFHKRPNTESHNQSISKKRTGTGIYRLSHNNGWLRYSYYDEKGVRKSFSRKTFSQVKQWVLDNGFEWIVLDEKLAKKTEGMYSE